MARIRLVEKISVSIPKENIEIFEKPILFEDSKGATHQKIGKVKDVPVTTYNENLNGRVYPKTLWQKVYEAKTFEGSLCRADHPTDDGSVKDICGVWSNFRVLEDYSIADLTVVGEYGRNMIQIIEAGGKLGVSTVGLGELSEMDNKTVKDDYMYEFCDLVMVPSQGVFITNENIKENKQNITLNIEKTFTNKKEEKTSEKNSTSGTEESYAREGIKVTNFEGSKLVSSNEARSISPLGEGSSNNTKIDENKSEVKNMSDKIFEASLANQINRTIKESSRKDNIAEAIDDLSSLVIPEHMVEEKAKVRETLSTLQTKLEESKKEIQNKFNETELSYKELKEKYEVQSKMLEAMKAKFNKVDAVIKEHGLDNIKDIDVLKESVSEAIHDIGKLKEEKSSLLSDMKIAMTERVDMLKDIKAYTKKVKISETEKVELSKKIKELTEKIKFDKSYIKQLEEKLIEEGYEIKEAKSSGKSTSKIKQYKSYIAELKEKLEEEDKKDDEEEGEDMKEEKDTDKDEKEDEEKELKEQIKRLEKRLRKIGYKFVEEEETDYSDYSDLEDDEKLNEEKDEDKEDDDDDKMAKIRAAKKEAKDEDEEDEDDDEKKESVLRKELKGFFQEQVKSFPGLKDFEKEVIKSRSFIEAVNKIDRIKEKKSGEQVKFSEMTLKKSWIPEGRI